MPELTIDSQASERVLHAPVRLAQRGRFLSHVHSFRGVAIVCVVINHAMDLIAWGNGVAERLLYSLIQNATVPFMFIAGFLFQHLSARFEYRRYLSAKLRNVIMPYVVMSLPAIAHQYLRRYGLFESGRPALPEAIARGALALFTGTQLPVPFWFVPTIAVLYLAAPLLIAVDRRPRAYWLLPALITLAMFAHRPLHFTDIGHAVLYFAPAYLCGMFVSRHHDRIMQLAARRLGALALACAGLVVLEVLVLGRGGAVFSSAPFTSDGGLVDVNLPLKLLLSVVVLELLLRHDALVRDWLSGLAEVSFGIFFVHRYLLIAAETIARHRGFHFPTHLGSLLLLSAFAGGGSIAIIWVIRRALGARSRYVIGC